MSEEDLQQQRRNRYLMLAIIVAPMLLAIAYYAFVADARYVSQAQISVRAAGNGAGPQVSGLAMLLAGSNTTSREETLYLRQYIGSGDMLAALDENLQWSEHYVAGPWRDPLYRLGTDPTSEERLSFYQRLVRARFDDETGLLTVTVQALTPEFAQQTLQFILRTSEAFVNELSHRMAREELQFAEAELARSHRGYEAERDRILEFQRSNQFFNPEEAAKGRAAIIADLEAQLVAASAELAALQARLAPAAPAVRAHRTRMAALERQLAVEKQRLLSERGAEKLNLVAARFRKLEVDVRIAEETYKLSVAALQSARIEAARKIRSLVTVVSPNLPNEAIYPRRAYNLGTLAIVLALVYGIARFLIASIGDHRD